MLNFDTLKITFEGASHAEFVGATLFGVPAGISVDDGLIEDFMSRRRSRGAFTTPRHESDKPIFISGIADGKTTGEPIHVRIINENVRRGDYNDFVATPRPAHADYVAFKKYGKDFDMSGGGPFSGRMTAPICAIGAVAKAYLSSKNVRTLSYVSSIGEFGCKSYRDVDYDFDLYRRSVDGDLSAVFLHGEKSEAMAYLKSIAEEKDSVGGKVECIVKGLPVGLGGELDKGIELKLASAIWTIPAVKGVELGDGFSMAEMKGSCANDAFAYDESGDVTTITNHAGGVNGGITNGSELHLSVGFRPTPTIGKPQNTVNLVTGENTVLEGKGRHDVCIALRAPVVVESMACIALLDEFITSEV